MCAIAFYTCVILCNLIYAAASESPKPESMYTCVHGKGDDKENELQHTYLGEPTHRVEKRSFDQHLRIHIHYDEPTISQLSASKSDLLKEVLIPAATEYFESVLRVRRLDVPVTLARTCIRKKSVLFRNDPRRYCQFGCNANTLCGSVVVPQRHLQACWISNGRTKVSVGQSGPGVNNTDYLLYVSAKLEGFCQQGAFAYASVCQLEATLDRPVVGFINVCPDKFHLTLQSRAFMSYVMRHEITHGLGFLPNLFAFFRDGKGNPLTARHHITRRPPIVKGRYMASERVIRRIVRKSWKVKMGFISLGMTLLVTENVKREVRRHFGCSHLEGAELEDQDVSSGTGSHWEKRLFENEVMTASVSQNPVYSRITLALLQDTGWYDVDYKKADMLYWGRGLGCEFAMTSCMDYMERQHTRNRSVLPYCDVVSGGGVIQSRCNPERNALVRCNLMKYTKNLPTRYQNFQNLSGVTSSDIGRCGGMITYADFCPYWTMFTRPTRHGKQMGSECSVADNQPDNNILLEHYGTHSICLHHSAMWRIHNGTTRLKPVFSGSGCYKYECDLKMPGQLFVYVSNKHFICTKARQALEINVHVNGTVVNGTLVCPSYLQECRVSTTRTTLTTSTEDNDTHSESVTSPTGTHENDSTINIEEKRDFVSAVSVSTGPLSLIYVLCVAILATRLFKL